MGMAQDLVNAGFHGYSGWGDAEAAADYNATGGAGKGGGGSSSSSSSSGSGFKTISAQDFAALEEKAFEMLKPYYLKIAQESRGDFDRAIKVLDEDYQRGVRVATEDYTRNTGDVTEDLDSALKQLGIQETIETEDTTDQLNKRGMAVGEMSKPTGPFEVLTGGRGRVEVDRLREQQALRKEAKERASGRQLEQLGIDFKRYTNPPAGGASPGTLSTADRGTLGTAELGYVRGREDKTRAQQIKETELFDKRRQEAFSIASTLGGIQAKEVPTGLTNRYLQGQGDDFKKLGVM